MHGREDLENGVDVLADVVEGAIEGVQAAGLGVVEGGGGGGQDGLCPPQLPTRLVLLALYRLVLLHCLRHKIRRVFTAANDGSEPRKGPNDTQ